MKVNEIKETKEVVVRTEYVAEDGTIFLCREECEAYEETAIAVAKRKLKRLDDGKLSEYDMFNMGCEDCGVEVFDIQTQQDLDNLEMYLRLKVGKYDESKVNPFTSVNGQRKDYVFENVTYGHEVIIFWSYDEDWFYVYKDGSIKGYLDYVLNKWTKLIYSNKEEETNDKE